MRLEAEDGVLRIWVEHSLSVSDVKRLHEAVSTFKPSRLTLNLTTAGSSDPFALALLGRELAALPSGSVELRGIDQHQMRLLNYLGFHVDQDGVHTG